MKLRNIVMLSGAVALLGGCVVAPHPHHGYYESRAYYYDDYRNTPSYEGYYYVRVIFIANVPYYVDDDRHVRPIPPHLHTHFRKYAYREQLRSGPAFSRESEVRDGYPMSRIIYRDNVPYHVDDDRVARPLPNHMHERFRYSPPGRNGARQEPAFSRERERQEAPAFSRERERQETPAFSRERERQEAPAFSRERERQEAPAFSRERERQEAPAFSRERERQEIPAPGRDGEEAEQNSRAKPGRKKGDENNEESRGKRRGD